MDKVTAFGAFQSASIDVTVKWDASGNVMTLTPKAPLEYASGTRAQLDGLAAKAYAYSLISSAKDLAGNVMASDVNVSFKTLRQVSEDLTGSVFVMDTKGAVRKHDDAEDCTLTTGETCQGDYTTSARSIAQFDLGKLPAGTKAVVSASIAANFHTITSQVITSLGQLQVTHLFENPVTSASLLSPGLGIVGPILTDTTKGHKVIDVTDATKDDFANRAVRGSLSQFRLGFPKLTDDDEQCDYVYSYCEGLMSIVYLVP